MADVTLFKSTPLVELSNITVVKNTPNVTTREYAYTKLSANTLRLYYTVAAIDDVVGSYESTQYATTISVKVLVTYWNEDGTAQGISQLFVLYPYNKFEKDASNNKLDMELGGKYIKKLDVTLIYTGEKASAVFSVIKLKASNALNESLDDGNASSMGGTSLASISTYSNGCKLFYDGDPNPDILAFNADTDGSLLSISRKSATGEILKTIVISKNASALP